jgi:hypothetical protein
MNRIPRLLCAALLLCCAGAERLVAQEPDAFLLRPGELRVQAGGAYTHARGWYGPGALVPVGGGLAGPLHAGNFAPLRPLEAELRAFYAATQPLPGAGAVEVGPETLQLGALDFATAANRRAVVASLALGVLPRLQLGVRLPILQEERLVQRLGLTGGTVAPNPSPDANAARLAAVDARWRELGGAAFLPTSGSALGRELQQRVRALTGGDSLQLPAAAPGVDLLQQQLPAAFGVAPLASGLLPWTLGDLEVEARLGLFDTFGGAPYPVEPGDLDLRTAVTLGVRLPTGGQADTLAVPVLFDDTGLAALHGRVEADLFLGRRVWTTLRAGYTAFRPVDLERRLVAWDAPLGGGPAQPVRWRPGNQLELRVLPRYRLTEEISFGAEYALLHAGAAAHAVDGVGAEPLARAAGASHRLSIGGRYTTLPAHHLGARLLPAEVGIRYRTTLGGVAGTVAASSVEAELSLFPRLFGR